MMNRHKVDKLAPRVNYEIISEKKDRNTFYNIEKRMLDIVASFIGLILLSPILAIISITYLFEEKKGPIFFKQKRVGMKGKPFYIFKFRSMVIDAEERLKANKKLYTKYIANGYKLLPEEDPRITKVGVFLRKTSLDELPQFINVLKGDMSLVGPRPVVTDELKEYGNQVTDLLSVKPGVTGFWQVSGRSNVNYPERVDLELFNVYQHSIWFDIKILFKTVSTVLLKKGAY